MLIKRYDLMREKMICFIIGNVRGGLMFCFGFMFVWEDLVIGIRKGLVLWFLEMVSVFVIYVMGVLV